MTTTTKRRGRPPLPPEDKRLRGLVSVHLGAEVEHKLRLVLNGRTVSDVLREIVGAHLDGVTLPVLAPDAEAVLAEAHARIDALKAGAARAIAGYERERRLNAPLRDALRRLYDLANEMALVGRRDDWEVAREIALAGLRAADEEARDA